jgi:large subunit ribosomal protein L25
MSVIPLKVTKRETGKQVSKRYRRDGFVPGIFYFEGNSIPILTKPNALKPIVFTSATRIINLEIEGENEPRECVLKDVTFDPITDLVRHFDLLGIESGHLITVEVPIKLKGQSIGVRLGGLLQHIVRHVAIKCVPTELPEHIELDITNLKVGDSLMLKDAGLTNIHFEVPLETVVCSVVPPRVGEEPKAPGAKVEGEEKPAAEKK